MLEGLVTGKELITAKNKRIKNYDTKKILKGSEQPYYELDWILDKELKTEIRIKKEKPMDEQFENYVWNVFYKLGFINMNRDRTFKLVYGKSKGTTQQIDVFAADEETAIVIECKYTSQKGKTSNFKKQIEAIAGQRENIIRAINADGNKRKVKFILATKNYMLSKVDKERLENFEIEHFSEETLEYYADLAKHLGRASRFQLLGQLFKNRKIEGMKNRIPAIRGKMGNKTYYAFSIEPEKLLKLGYVLHRTNSNKAELPSYQRIIKKSRLDSVQEFVANGGFFPNSIVVNIDSKKLKFDKTSATHDSSISDLGVLYLPNVYRSLYIIDGQHRLYGYSNSEYASKNTVPVVAFVELTKPEQVKLFMEINENQKSVSKNLRNTLNADLLWDSDKKSDQMKSLSLRVAQSLGIEDRSPLQNRIVFGEDKANEYTFLKIESVAESIQKTGFLNKYSSKNELTDNGLLDKNNNEMTLNILSNYLIEMFRFVKENASEEWNKGKNGVLLTNVGVHSFIRLFYTVLHHIEKDKNIKMISQNYQEVVKLTIPYMKVVCDYINDLESTERIRIRKSFGGGAKSSYQKRMQVVINEHFPNFKPDGIEKDKIEFKKTFNDYGKEILPKLKYEIRKRFETSMEILYGNNWDRQLPKNIYLSAGKRQIDKNYSLSSGSEYTLADVLNLEDYANVAVSKSNWRDVFEKEFSKPSELKRKKTKEQKIQWLNDLAKLDSRNLSEYSITMEENSLLEELEKWLLA